MHRGRLRLLREATCRGLAVVGRWLSDRELTVQGLGCDRTDARHRRNGRTAGSYPMVNSRQGRRIHRQEFDLVGQDPNGMFKLPNQRLQGIRVSLATIPNIEDRPLGPVRLQSATSSNLS